MNTDWSEHIQGIDTLYLSRKNRFSDYFQAQYKALFKLDETAKIDVLEVGCGPGALLEALKRWYPNAALTGADRDSAFIAFAQKQLPAANLAECDATALPFRDGSFDVTLSNTVSEHIEPTGFFGEQRRVLKTGGICIVLSARRGLCVTAKCLQDDDRERDFWDRAAKVDTSFEDYAVCRYPMNETELPQTMERYGFSRVTTGYVIADFTPDDSKYSRAFAREMILSEYRAKRVTLAAAARDLKQHFTSEEILYMIKRTDDKFALRLGQLERGEKQWDTLVSVTQVVRGVKEG